MGHVLFSDQIRNLIWRLKRVKEKALQNGCESESLVHISSEVLPRHFGATGFHLLHRSDETYTRCVFSLLEVEFPCFSSFLAPFFALASLIAAFDVFHWVFLPEATNIMAESSSFNDVRVLKTSFYKLRPSRILTFPRDIM